MKSTSYEYKHPKGEKSAYVSHDVYDNGDEEFLAHVPSEKVTRHSSFEKAEKRVQKHGYDKHEEPQIDESVVPKTLKFLSAKFDGLLESALPSKISHRKYGWGTLVTVGNVNSSVILHPEHMEKVKALQDGEQTHFKDETNTRWTAARNGDQVSFTSPGRDNTGHTVSLSKLTQPLARIDEMVMDSIKHPTLGRVEWRNQGGAHTISTTNKETGSQNIHAIGTHQDIASKWAKIKDRLLQEDTQWECETQQIKE